MADAKIQNPNGRAKGIGLLLVQGLVSLGVGYWVFFQTFQVAGCGSTCDYTVVDGAWSAQVWLSVGVFFASLLAIFWYGRNGRECWWLVTTGIIAVIVAGVVATIAITVATAV